MCPLHSQSTKSQNKKSISGGSLWLYGVCAAVCTVGAGICHEVDMLTGPLHLLLLPAAVWWAWVIFNGFSETIGLPMCWETEALEELIRLFKKWQTWELLEGIGKMWGQDLYLMSLSSSVTIFHRKKVEKPKQSELQLVQKLYDASTTVQKKEKKLPDQRFHHNFHRSNESAFSQVFISFDFN